MLNFLEGRGLTFDVRQWFDHSVPSPRVSPTWIRRLLKGRIVGDDPRAERRFVWLGGRPVCEPLGKRTRLILPGHSSDQSVTLADQQAQWLDHLIRHSTPQRNATNPYPLFLETKTTFPGTTQEFESCLETTSWKKVRNAGLLPVCEQDAEKGRQLRSRFAQRLN